MSRKRLPIYLTVLFFALAVVSCGKSKNTTEKIVTMEKSLIEVSIGGMTCTGCEQKIQAGITKLEGIGSVKASHITGKALVEFYPGITDTVKIKEAVTVAGYTVSKINLNPAAAE